MIKKKEKINVLFILLQLGIGGSEKVALDLARYLNQDLFNFFVVYFSPGELEKEFEGVCVKTFHVPKNSGLDPKLMRNISHIISAWDIDVVNPHHYTPFFYSYPGAKLFHNRGLVYTEHSVLEINRLPLKYKIASNLFYMNTDALIGVSKEISDCFIRAYPIHKKKVHYITNGIDIDFFSQPVHRNVIRRDLGLNPSDYAIGAIANFRKIKNHACLLRAFQEVLPDHPHLRLVLVGKGVPGASDDTEAEIRKWAASSEMKNRVILTGYRSDITSILGAIDLFCLPSYSEGLPVSILEAMAAGVTVVGSNVDGINEVISDGNTGILFPSDDSRSLAMAIRRLINDPDLSSRLKNNAFAYVTHAHGIQKAIVQYQDVFLKSAKK